MGSLSLSDFLASLPPALSLRGEARVGHDAVLKQIRAECKLAVTSGVLPADTEISVRKLHYASFGVSITAWRGGAVFLPEYELTIRDPSIPWVVRGTNGHLSVALVAALDAIEHIAQRHNYDNSRIEEDYFDVGYYLTVDATPVIARAQHAIRLEHDAAFAALVDRARAAAVVIGPKALQSACGRVGFDGASEWTLQVILKRAARASASAGPLVYDKRRRGWVAQ